MRHPHLLRAATLVSAALCSACSGSEEPAANPSVEATPTAQAPAEAAPSPEELAAQSDAELNQKLAKYVRSCLNSFSNSIGSSRDRYLLWVGTSETGPTGSERHVYGIHRVASDPAECRTAVTEAAAMAPSNAQLEGAAEAYAAALELVVPRINEVHQYYQREDYKDDAFARGRELHGPLMEAFAAFDAAKGPLSTLVGGLNRELTERRLARLESQPEREAELLVERTILIAEDLVTATEGWSVEDAKLTGVDGERFATLVSNFEAQADKLGAYVASANLEGMSGRNIRDFAETGQAMVRFAKGLNRRIRDQEPFSRSHLSSLGSGSAWTVEDAPPRLVREYNQLVSTYNRIRW